MINTSSVLGIVVAFLMGGALVFLWRKNCTEQRLKSEITRLKKQNIILKNSLGDIEEKVQNHRQPDDGSAVATYDENLRLRADNDNLRTELAAQIQLAEDLNRNLLARENDIATLNSNISSRDNTISLLEIMNRSLHSLALDKTREVLQLEADLQEARQTAITAFECQRDGLSDKRDFLDEQINRYTGDRRAVCVLRYLKNLCVKSESQLDFSDIFSNPE